MKLLITLSILIASWYAEPFNGKTTASGAVYNMYDFTCAASWHYRLGDSLRVTNVQNGKSVDVVVNDRGNFESLGRTLDLSMAAFREIADLDEGLVKVKIERL